jgi:predicted phosphodiesterase
MEPNQTPKELKLTHFIQKFVGTQTCPTGLVHYVDSQGQLHELHSSQLPKKNGMIRIVAISDTHERHDLLDLPSGDVLLHCGDALMFNTGFSPQVSTYKLRSFNKWLSTTPHKERIFIGGNHDAILETLGKAKVQQILTNCHYLENEHHTLKCGLTLFGTPASVANTPQSPNKAFQYDMTVIDTMFKHNVRPTIDILMTHGPVSSLPPAQRFIEEFGTPLAFCGHIHEQHGVQTFHRTICANASTMAAIDQKFSPSNPPVVLDVARTRGHSIGSHL